MPGSNGISNGVTNDIANGITKSLNSKSNAHLNTDGSPLSWFQQRLWVHYQRSPDDTSYNLPCPLLIWGNLNIPALEQSLNAIAARHESLRTTYGETDDGEPLQFIAPPRHTSLPVVPVDNTTQLLDHFGRFLEHSFDLHRGPIFIARLLRLVPTGHHLLLLSLHHIAADAWSLKTIMRAELQTAYAAFSQAQEPALPPLTLQYRDYAGAQRAADMSTGTEYWSLVLRGYEDSLEFPTTQPRQRHQLLKPGAKKSGTLVHSYPGFFSRELERLARDHGSTMFMVLLAALGLTVSRYVGKDDLCIGTTTSNRPSVALEPLIGFFVNIVPLRIRIDEQSSTTVADLLKAVRSLVLGAFEHPLPFEQILQAAATDVTLHREGRNPLVPIVMRHQNFPEVELAAAMPDGVTFKPYPDPGGEPPDQAVLDLLAREHVPARCEIEMSYAGGAEGLAVEVVYDAELYDRRTIERLLAYHQHVLQGMFGDPGRHLLQLPMLRDSDVAELLERSDRELMITDTPGLPFLERFHAQVDKASEVVACWDSDGSRSWTYLDLSRRASSVARAIRSQGTKPGDLVAVCLPRGGDLLATLLGVWEAGAAYVPLDPAYPITYTRQMIDNACPSTIICDASHQALLDMLDDSRCLLPEQIANAEFPRNVPQEDDPQHPANPTPDSLAYVMYTSGSTGKPKGVRVPHRQLNNWLSFLEQNLPFEAGEVIGQKTTSVFAVGVKEMFAGLLNRCPQVVIDDQTVRDVAAFVDALTKHRVSRLNILPSHLASVIEHLKSNKQQLPALRVCITAGEPLSKAQVLGFRTMFPHARLLNCYGCTELNDITVYDTAFFDQSLDFVPIGTPIPNTKLYVLDRYGRLVPDRVPGELYVASLGLPEGYNGPDADALTAQRFSHNPFISKSDTTVPAWSTRLYNTGDVVRRLPDGSLDYIGRWDLQVKVRGFRIDLQQIEQVMGDFEGGILCSCAVAGQGDRLTAFYTTATTNNGPVGGQETNESTTPPPVVKMTDLRSFLRSRLPAYMVPDTFILLDTMPLLPNGKLNRRALLLTQQEGELQQSSNSDKHDPPASETERAVARIWGVVVNVPVARIGRQTHFFDIGGHSLSAMRVLARIKDAFSGIEVGLSELFDAPRLEAIAAVIDEKLKQQGWQGQIIGNKDKSHDHEGGEQAELLQLSKKRQRKQVYGLLQDKIVLVTGGSRGIGLATSLLVAEQGAKVAINFRDSRAAAESARDQILAGGVGTAEVFQADVTNPFDVSVMVSAIETHFGGPVDVLVCNAHMLFRHRSFLEHDFADLQRKVVHELQSVFNPCRAVVPGMLTNKQGKGGSIVVLSSTLSKRSVAEGFLAQTTAKAAVDGFVRSLAAELGPHGVRINTVAPGVTLTDAAIPMAGYVKESIAAICPMRRNGLPEDMAGAVLFLASDLSRFMTGTYLPVDGGFTTL